MTVHDLMNNGPQERGCNPAQAKANERLRVERGLNCLDGQEHQKQEYAREQVSKE